jgi:hypothetical protein
VIGSLNETPVHTSRMRECIPDLFREVNNQITGLGEVGFPLMELVCECRSLDCHERISLTGDEYERVRSRRCTSSSPWGTRGRVEVNALSAGASATKW